MTTKITVTYQEIDDCDQFTISVLHPNQVEKNFIFKDGVAMMSHPFDQLLSCIFNVPCRSHRVSERLISVGLPSEYEDVQVESQLFEYINSYDELMGRFGRVLSDVSKSIKKTEERKIGVDVIELDI